jgi:MFS family permease
MLVGHLIPYASSIGTDTSLAALFLSLFSCCCCGGRWLFGYLFDTWGRTKSLFADTIVMCAGLSILAYCPTTDWGFPSSVILVGLAYGGIAPLYAAHLLHLFGVLLLYHCPFWG